MDKQSGAKGDMGIISCEPSIPGSGVRQNTSVTDEAELYTWQGQDIDKSCTSGVCIGKLSSPSGEL